MKHTCGNESTNLKRKFLKVRTKIKVTHQRIKERIKTFSICASLTLRRGEKNLVTQSRKVA